MEKLELGYYFEDLENFRFSKIFERCTYPWEVLAKTKSFIKEFI